MQQIDHFHLEYKLQYRQRFTTTEEEKLNIRRLILTTVYFQGAVAYFPKVCFKFWLGTLSKELVTEGYFKK